jgi:hypothetical protein
LIPSVSLAICLVLAAAVLLFRTLREAAGLGARTASLLVLASAAVAWVVLLLRGYLLDILGWSLLVTGNRAGRSMMAAWFLSAPMEQASIALAVWPLVRGHRLLRWGTSLLAVSLAALGFSAIRTVWDIMEFGGGYRLVGEVFSTIVLVFTAACWGSLLTASRPQLARWFPLGWLGAVAVDGFVLHVVHGRSAGWLWALAPLAFAMLVVAAFTVRRLSGPRESMVLSRTSLLGFFPETPGLSTMRAAWKHGHRHALLHWIVGGAVVSFGASLVGLVSGVFLAQRLGIDLGRIFESDKIALCAFLVLGGCVLVSFALSGYLVARASAADSVFETGMGALVAIAFLTTLLTMASSAIAVLGLALAPFAFALACVGAWLGIDAPRGHE